MAEHIEKNKTMNLIVISYMFPKLGKPYLGIFVKEQLLEINNIIDGRITVISPVAWEPRILFRNKKDQMNTPYKYTLDGITVYHPRYLTFPGNMLIFIKIFTMFLAVLNILIRNNLISKNNIFHAHWLIPDCLIAIVLKKIFKIKLVCTAHGDDINLFDRSSFVFKTITRYIAKEADALIAVSGKLKVKINEISPSCNVHVVTNGFNAHLAKSAMKMTKLDHDEVNLLFVGNVCFEKGIRELLAAFHKLLKNGVNAKMTIVGEIYEKIWLNEFVSTHSLTDYVNLIGPVEHSNIFKYYRDSDIFVLPSYSEGMPTVMFEAMACKLPVIISKVGGVDEVINDGVNGVLINPKSTDDLFSKLLLLINNREIANKFAENAYRDVYNKYSWQHNAVAMVNIYKEILLEQQ